MRWRVVISRHIGKCFGNCNRKCHFVLISWKLKKQNLGTSSFLPRLPTFNPHLKTLNPSSTLSSPPSIYTDSPLSPLALFTFVTPFNTVTPLTTCSSGEKKYVAQLKNIPRWSENDGLTWRFALAKRNFVPWKLWVKCTIF